MSGNSREKDKMFDTKKQRIPYLLILLWISVLFSPLIKLGVYLRIDHIFFILAFCFLVIKRQFHLIIPKSVRFFVLFALLLMFSATVSALLSSFVTGTANFYFVINWPAKVLLNIIIGVTIINLYGQRFLVLEKSLRLLWCGIAVMGLIGVIQAAEFHHFIPNIGLNTFLSKFFPYKGESVDDLLIKTGGYILKMGGAGRATSTMDGHPILLGDFLAFILSMFLPFAHNVQNIGIYLISVLCLLLTLSRGAVVGWISGISVYLILIVCHSLISGKGKEIPRFITLLLLVVGTFFVTFQYTPFAEKISWRLTSTIDTLMNTGVPEERLTDRWPSAINALNEAGALGWLLGVPGGYSKSTDSQYFWFLVNVGLMGVILLLYLHVFLFSIGWRFFTTMWPTNQQIALWGLGYAAAIIALLIMYIFHPALQGDRLLTTLIVVSILLDNTISNQRGGKMRSPLRL
ncbi:MAG TPA: hypothetical protein DEA73_07270 [Peptococcaceae bacterium]|nr:MAG: hypothetical protein XD51_0158 [Moorella sp. 60_41]HBT47658.1 hypothetical protein [Peptococcaceae bacterium]